MSEFGITIPNELDYAGISDLDMFSDLITRYELKGVRAEELVKRKWKAFDNAPFMIAPLPLVTDLIISLSRAGFALGVASGSPKVFIVKVLETLSLTPFIHQFVSSEEVEKGKPAPDVFLKAARLLNVPSSRTLVIEDGRAGIRGAKAAGMKTVFLGEPLDDADLTISSFSELTVGTIEALLER